MVSLLNPSSNLLEFTADSLNLLSDNAQRSCVPRSFYYKARYFVTVYRETALIKGYCSVIYPIGGGGLGSETKPIFPVT